MKLNAGLNKPLIILWLVWLSCQMTPGTILDADAMEKEPTENSFSLHTGEEKVLKAENMTLNTHGSRDLPDSAQIFGHVVKLYRLSPYPRQDSVTDSREYKATLTVAPIK